MNRLVTSIVATLMISVIFAWCVLLVKGASWLTSDRTVVPAVVAGSEVTQNTPPISTSRCDLMAIRKPYPAAAMEAYQLSPRVGNVKNTDAAQFSPRQVATSA